MKLDQKGFSLIELLGIIVITSVIIIPLMTTFVNFFEINNRMHDRRNAVGIADVAQNTLTRLDFLELKAELDLSAEHHMMLTLVEGTPNQCNFTFTDIAVQDVCALIFSLEYNSMSIPLGDMQIFLLDYNISESEHLFFDQMALETNPSIPHEVLEAIHDMPVSSGEEVSSIMRYVIYIKYSDDPRGVIILDGVYIND